jgi:dTDP-4-amino-4,6-dideoxygalactose transaminase
MINTDRLNSWHYYYKNLKPLEEKGSITLPYIPETCSHNGHMFYIKAKDLKERTQLLSYLNKHHIGAVFHYVPLHSSEAGLKFGIFFGKDVYTTKESERIIRLPMFYNLNRSSQDYVIEKIYAFYHQ